MARTEARIFTDIWTDDEAEDFRLCSSGAQRLYFVLLSQSDLNFCGVLSYSVEWLAALAPDTTARQITKWLDELACGDFIHVDKKSGELWVRSFVRRDGILSSPNLIRAMTRDYPKIRSRHIRERFLEGLGEGFLEGLPERFPKGFGEGFEQGFPDGFLEGFRERFDKGLREPPRGRAQAFPVPPSSNPLPPASDQSAEEPSANGTSRGGRGDLIDGVLDRWARQVVDAKVTRGESMTSYEGLVKFHVGEQRKERGRELHAFVESHPDAGTVDEVITGMAAEAERAKRLKMATAYGETMGAAEIADDDVVSALVDRFSDPDELEAASDAADRARGEMRRAVGS